MPKLDRDSVELRDVFDPFSLDFERDVDGEAPVVEDGLALDLSPYLSPGCRGVELSRGSFAEVPAYFAGSRRASMHVKIAN